MQTFFVPKYRYLVLTPPRAAQLRMELFAPMSDQTSEEDLQPLLPDAIREGDDMQRDFHKFAARKKLSKTFSSMPTLPTVTSETDLVGVNVNEVLFAVAHCAFWLLS